MKIRLILLSLLLLSSCRRQKEKEEDVIVRIGKETLTKEDLKLFGISETNLEMEINKALIDNWIKSTLFYLAAKEEGLDQLPEMKRKLKWSERSILAQEYLSRKTQEISVDELEIEEILKKQGNFFQEGVNLLIVFFSDSVRGIGIRRSLSRKGRIFRRELRKLREDPTVSVMETGIINLGSFLYEFEGIPNELKNAVTKMKIGEISNIFKVEEGYVLIKILSKSPLEIDTLKTKEFLRQILLNKKREEMEDSLYGVLKGEFDIIFEGG